MNYPRIWQEFIILSSSPIYDYNKWLIHDDIVEMIFEMPFLKTYSRSCKSMPCKVKTQISFLSFKYNKNDDIKYIQENYLEEYVYSFFHI